MSDTAPILVTRPAADPQAAARARLRDAIAALRDDEERLGAVEAGRDRARTEARDHWLRQQECERELAAAEADESQRAVYDYVNRETTISPARAAAVRLEATRKNLSRIEQIEKALDTEIAGLQSRLNHRRTQLHEALAEVVVHSPQFLDLIERQLSEAWARLRGVRKAAHTIQQALMGNMPREFEIKWQSSISLDPVAKYPGGVPIPTDEAPSIAWATALEQLLLDPNADLPAGF